MGPSSVDCSQLVATLVDRSPQRSPQAVHSVLAARFRGLDVVEIGTNSGDGMNCFAQVARSATAIEVDPRPCRLLRERSGGCATAQRERADQLSLDLSPVSTGSTTSSTCARAAGGQGGCVTIPSARRRHRIRVRILGFG